MKHMKMLNETRDDACTKITFPLDTLNSRVVKFEIYTYYVSSSSDTLFLSDRPPSENALATNSSTSIALHLL